MTRGLVLLIVTLVGTVVVAQPKDPILSAKQKSSAKLTSEAAKLLQRSEWEGGIRLCDSALRLDPENVDARWMRGLAYLKKKDPDQAIADFSLALKRDPKMAPALRDRGIAYMDKKEYDRAITDFSEYLTIRPTDPEGYIERAGAYRAKGESAKADADLKKADELRKGPKGK